MKENVSFWVSLIDTISKIRPTPILSQQPSLIELRQAVIGTYRLHIKWTIKSEATPERVRILPACVNNPGTGASRSRASWVLMLDDGIHVIIFDLDDHIKLRRLDTGEVVWESYLDIASIHSLDYTLFEGDIIIILNVYCDEYVCLSHSAYHH
jgi:hypothetical protein